MKLLLLQKINKKNLFLYSYLGILVLGIGVTSCMTGSGTAAPQISTGPTIGLGVDPATASSSSVIGALEPITIAEEKKTETGEVHRTAARAAAVKVLVGNEKAAKRIVEARQELRKIEEAAEKVLSDVAGKPEENRWVATIQKLKAEAQIEEAEALLEAIQGTAIGEGTPEEDKVRIGLSILVAEAAIIKELATATKQAAAEAELAFIAIEEANKLLEKATSQGTEEEAKAAAEGLKKAMERADRAMTETMRALAKAQASAEAGETAIRSLD